MTQYLVTLDFKDEKALLELTRAILYTQYGLEQYDLPKENLIPRVPQRVAYLDWIKQLFDTVEKEIISESMEDNLIDESRQLIGFDIGTGANLIYPILGILKYNMKFAGSDINQDSIQWATTEILNKNKKLQENFIGQIRLQKDYESVLEGVISVNEIDEKFDFTMCNPPFFNHEEERTFRHQSVCPITKSEDSTIGGEIRFLCEYAQESLKFKNQVKWFTSLIGKKTTYEFIKNYIVNMLKFDSGEEEYDILIASGEIEEGQTKRWLIGWRFIKLNQLKY
eukprot:403370045